MLDTENTIREYLAGVLHMSLATVSNNRPWVSEVHFVYDDDLNLYFRSKTSRRHSQEIAANPQVAGNVVAQHNLGTKPRAVYFEGVAEQIAVNDETDPILRLFMNRLGTGNNILDDAVAPDGHKFYKITVSDFYLFDARESNPSQKYHLPWPSK